MKPRESGSVSGADPGPAAEAARVPRAGRTDYAARSRIERWLLPLLERTIEERLARFASPVARGGRCLDVGCGGQPFRARLEGLGFAYSSLDVVQNASGTVEFLGALDEPLPEALRRRAAFQFILCTEVLEHVARWPEAFANLVDLLAPGGRLLVTCPHIWIPHEEPYDFHRPTTHALEFHARRAGLRLLDLDRLGDGYDVLGTVLALTHVRPAGNPLLWVLALPAYIARRLALQFLRARWMRHLVALRTPLYLSTIGVFEKSRRGAARARRRSARRRRRGDSTRCRSGR